MKKLYLLLAILSATTGMNCQTILNGDFEDTSGSFDIPNWSINWGLYGPMGISDTVDPYSGQYYFEMYSVRYPMGMGNFAGILTNGTLDYWLGPVGGKPFSTRPDFLIGYYKYIPGDVDEFLIEAFCTKYDSLTQTRDTICSAIFSGSDTVLNWQRFDIPFIYQSCDYPDTLQVGVFCSLFTVNNTFFKLDSIGVSGELHNPYENEKICAVSIDTITWKNMIMWEKTPNYNTMYYNIYKEITLNNYSYLGSVQYGDPSYYVDITSVPESHADKYKITAVDSCENESALSPYHKTMNLVLSSFGSTMGLSWSPYEDESGIFVPDQYFIYRGTSPDNMSILDSISSSFTSYNDINVFSVYYYMIGVRKTPPCNVSAFEMSFSNNKDNSTLVNINTGEIACRTILISPNPMTISATMEIPNFKSEESFSDLVLRISDLTGKTIRIISGKDLNNLQINSSSNFQIRIERGELNPGIYFIELIGDGIVYRGKLLVE